MQGDRHRRARKLLQPIFSVNSMKLIEPIIQAYATELEAKLDASLGEPAPFHEISGGLVLNVIGKAGGPHFPFCPIYALEQLTAKPHRSSV